MALTSTISNKLNDSQSHPATNQISIDLNSIGTTLTELVALAADKQVQVMGYAIATNTATKLTFKSGSDVIVEFILTANSNEMNLLSGLSEVKFAGSSGANLSITSSDTVTAGRLYLQYKVRDI